jgi:hypothetical protein
MASLLGVIEPRKSTERGVNMTAQQSASILTAIWIDEVSIRYVQLTQRWNAQSVLSTSQCLPPEYRSFCDYNIGLICY